MFIQLIFANWQMILADKLSHDCPIFLVGLPRSGSTLWMKVIGNHPGVASFTEVHFLSFWHSDFRKILKNVVGDLSKEQNVEKLLDVIFSKNHIIEPANSIWFWKQIRNLEEHGLKNILRERLLSSSDRSIGVIFRILIEEATRCQGKHRAVVKFPVYPVYIGQLLEWWPNGRIVHISRDPRALAASKTNDPGGTAKLINRYPWLSGTIRWFYKYFAVLQYIWTSRIHMRFVDKENYRLFKYEELVNEPEKTIRKLCEFCRLEYDESMLKPSEGQKSSITGKSSRNFDSSRTEGWKNILSERESRFITFLTRHSMERFGYFIQK